MRFHLKSMSIHFMANFPSWALPLQSTMGELQHSGGGGGVVVIKSFDLGILNSNRTKCINQYQISQCHWTQEKWVTFFFFTQMLPDSKYGMTLCSGCLRDDNNTFS